MKIEFNLRNKRVKRLILAIHFIGLALCIWLLFLTPFQDHLRWNSGYAIVWLTLLSALILPFTGKKGKWQSIGLKTYGIVWWIGSIILLIYMLLFPTFRSILFPYKKYCEQGNYIMREGYHGWIDPPVSSLYKKQGIWERYIRDYHLVLIDSFVVHVDIGAIVIKGKLWDWNGWEDLEETTSVDILDKAVFDVHTEEIKQLKKEVYTQEP